MGRESLVVETYLHRGLAVFRIGLCIALLWTLFAWWPDFDFFFTRLGPLPLSAIAVDTPPGTVAWSLYNASTGTSWPYLLYGLTLLMSAVLLLGWRTEQAGLLLFVLLWSLQSRTAVACDLRDGALLLGLLFGCLTPWGKVWALRSSPALSIRKGAFLGAIASVFIGAALLRPTSSLAGFLALAPRAHPVSEGVSYQTFAEDSQGKQRLLETKELQEGTYRRRLYQGRWEDAEYRGLAIWWTYWLYLQERSTSSGSGAVAVKLYRTQGLEQRRMVASWPLGVADRQPR